MPSVRITPHQPQHGEPRAGGAACARAAGSCLVCSSPRRAVLAPTYAGTVLPRGYSGATGAGAFPGLGSGAVAALLLNGGLVKHHRALASSNNGTNTALTVKAAHPGHQSAELSLRHDLTGACTAIHSHCAAHGVSCHRLSILLPVLLDIGHTREATTCSAPHTCLPQAAPKRRAHRLTIQPQLIYVSAGSYGAPRRTKHQQRPWAVRTPTARAACGCMQTQCVVREQVLRRAFKHEAASRVSHGLPTRVECAAAR
eukprot:6180464-Pleurochrysis_carterae.AAC.1